MTWIVESDEWGDGPNLLAEETLAAIERVLEESVIIVEHKFYRGSRAPERLFFEDYADFREYISRGWHPGDAFRVWRYDEICREDNTVASGKLPDERGRVPRRGPY